MSNDSLRNANPQFGTAEYSAKPGPDQCKSCSQTITGDYFRVNGVQTCASCAQQVQQRLPKDTHAVYLRGVLFGVGGALLGLVLYAGFGIITGLMIGYVSLAVGYIVGKAIMAGSGGIGGRRYQIAAVILTYAAVSTAAVPIAISQFLKAKKAQQPSHVVQSPPGQVQPDRPSQMDGAGANRQAHPATEPKASLGAALGWLALLGLASPFLELQDPLHGAIGLIILFVGLRIAWQLTAGTRTDVLGPFKLHAPAATG